MLDWLGNKIFSDVSKGHHSNPNDDIFKFVREDKIQYKECEKAQYSCKMNEAIQLPITDDKICRSEFKRILCGYVPKIEMSRLQATR